jgi:hypothetical protein
MESLISDFMTNKQRKAFMTPLLYPTMCMPTKCSQQKKYMPPTLPSWQIEQKNQQKHDKTIRNKPCVWERTMDTSEAYARMSLQYCQYPRRPKRSDLPSPQRWFAGLLRISQFSISAYSSWLFTCVTITKFHNALSP